MKTLRTKKINDIEIITGIGQLSICGVETRNNCRPKIAALEESKKLVLKGKERNEFDRRAREERKKEGYFLKTHIEHAKKGEVTLSEEAKSKARKHNQNSNDLYGSANTCNTEMKEIQKTRFPKERDILRNNPHFHEPGRGLLGKNEGENWPDYFQRVVDLETQYLISELDPHQVLKSDGTLIPDFRGKKFSKKISGVWGFGTITAIGVPIQEGATWDEDLTEDQKLEISLQVENDRLAGLSAEDKISEWNQKVLSLANQAQAMENGLKFSGDIDYQSKSQAFYDAEILKLNDKYGV